MNREPTRIEELKAKLAMAQDDLSTRTSELERVESERDALQARVKRLEDAGDKIWKMSGYMEPPKYWVKAKESNQ